MSKTVEGLHVIINPMLDEGILDDIIAAGPAVIQLRAKDTSPGKIIYYGNRLRQKVHGTEILFAMNDHVQLGVRTGADIVHVGQDDMPTTEVGYYLFPGMSFGVSVQNSEQALKAQTDKASYIGIPVFKSLRTKPDVQSVGINGLVEIAKEVSIPSIAIGGITHENAGIVMRNSARGLAVAGAVTRSRNPRESVLKFNEIIYKYRK